MEMGCGQLPLDVRWAALILSAAKGFPPWGEKPIKKSARFAQEVGK